MKKSQLATQIIEVISKDESSSTYFFGNSKDPDLFIPLKEAGFFDISKVPPIIRIDESKYRYPQWPQNHYLKMVAQALRKNEEVRSKNITKFLETLRNLYPIGDNQIIADFVFECVTLLPLEHLEISDVQSIFKLFVPSKHRNTLAEMVVFDGFENILGSVKNDEKSKTILSEYVKNMFDAKLAGESSREELMFFGYRGLEYFIPKHFDLEKTYSEKSFVFEVIIEVLSGLLEREVDDDGTEKSSQIWRPAIEPHSQNNYRTTPPAIYVEVLFMLSTFMLGKNHSLPIVDKWKRKKSEIFTRISIALATDFPQLVTIDVKGTIIDNLDFYTVARHEIFRYLKTHFGMFDTSLKKALLEKIKSLKYVDKNSVYTESDIEQISANEQMRWLLAINHTGDKDVQSLYNAVFAITNREVEHPDFSTYMSSGWYGPKSPWAIEDFAKAKSDEIFDKLINFKDSDSFRGPTKDGLARVFEEYILQDPLKCSALLSRLLELDYDYCTGVYNSYTKSWSEKKYVPVDKLLSLALQFFNDSKFVAELTNKRSRSQWLAASIFKFVDVGTRDDKNAFDPKHNPECWKILCKAEQVTVSDSDYVGSSDAFTRALNEPRGKLFEAAIVLALRDARLASKDAAIVATVWKKLYELLKPSLERTEVTEISLHAQIGAHYRQLMFLNEKWIFENLELIAPLDKSREMLWLAFMEGFSYVSAYVKEMFLTLENRGDLKRFLRFKLDSGENNSRLDRLQDRVIELSIVALVMEDVTTDSTVFQAIVSGRDEDEWRKLIWSFYGVVVGSKKQEYFEKAKKTVFDLITNFENTEKDLNWMKLFKGIDQMLALVADPNEAIVDKIVEIDARNSEGGWDMNDVIGFLHKFKNSHTNRIGELFLKIINLAPAPPSWPDDKIYEIGIALQSERPLLVTICRAYTDKSFSQDSPIYKACKDCGII